MPTARSAMSLYARSGARKYLNSDERMRFLEAAKQASPEVTTFCLTLAYTGCRISEALEISAASIQFETNIISIHCLKKRNHHVIREVPVPEALIQLLNDVHNIHKLQGDMHIASASSPRLWPWGRTWAWERVKAVMKEANISGLHASPKGLRHGFGVHAVHSGVPLNLVQKWLGHAQLSTTAIYVNAVGPDERRIAGRMW